MLLVQALLSFQAFVYGTDHMSGNGWWRSPFPKWIRFCSKRWLARTKVCYAGTTDEQFCGLTESELVHIIEKGLKRCGPIYSVLSGYLLMPGNNQTLFDYVDLLYAVCATPFLLVIRWVRYTELDAC